MKYVRIFLILGILCLTGIQRIEAKPNKTPPGKLKKQGRSQTQGEIVSPPGQAKKLQAPAMPMQDQLKQDWCLEQQGQVNVVLPDRSICDCVTETHAVMFIDEDGWAESLGVVLYHAVTLEKQPGLVVVVEKEEEPQELYALNAVLRTFMLPVALWKIGQD